MPSNEEQESAYARLRAAEEIIIGVHDYLKAKRGTSLEEVLAEHVMTDGRAAIQVLQETSRIQERKQRRELALAEMQSQAKITASIKLPHVISDIINEIQQNQQTQQDQQPPQPIEDQDLIIHKPIDNKETKAPAPKAPSPTGS